MSDPAAYTTQLRQKLIELRDLLAPADIKDYNGTIRLCCEIKLIVSLLKTELERREKESREFQSEPH